VVSDVGASYRTKLQSPSLDRAVAELAGGQHGIVTLPELLALGMTRSGIKRRVRSGRLHPLYRGVYAVGHAAVSPDGRRLAAVRACGPDALLSHRSAIALHGLRPTAQARVDVLTTTFGRRAPAGIRLHATRSLHPDDITTLRGMPVTSVARALVDFAAIAGPDDVERAVHQAEVLRILDVRAVEAALDRANGRKGTHYLKAITTPSPGPTRSVLEERFLALCRRHGIPDPTLNARISTDLGHLEVDALWPTQRLVVELDGAATHLTRRAFERDHRRDTALAAHRYTVLRFTWSQVNDEAEAVIRALRHTVRPPA
jgi:very-short-patch-repair endonuclease/predicted transcriptional regulator of viral defense system